MRTHNVIQAPKGLKVRAVGDLRGGDDAGQNRTSKCRLKAGSQPTKNLSSNDVEDGQNRDETQRNDGQHQQRIETMAG